MSKPLVDRIPFAKIVIVLAISFGVALGLCGLNLALVTSGVARGNNGFGGPIFGYLGILELAVMALAAVGLLVTTALWVVLSAVSGFSRKGTEPQKLFDDKDEDGSSSDDR